MIVRIKASRAVYRRCGAVFGKQPQDFADDRFTVAELETLQLDPVLTVTLVDGELQAGASQSGGVPAGGSASAEPPTTPSTQAAKTAPVKAAPKGKGGAKPGPRGGKGPAKAAGKSAAPADKDEQPAGDSANPPAKDAEGGTGAGQE
ncbi:HI1506-related protein [Pseudomonas citronellolis]|uniref:HI1506-related protein n=1 Tax=Pseudomonas citronellolis TaxID=53408 RepID=UPI000778EF5E|nr:HI1506-related protein [Pseudomonas citronellolis]AMO73843.1 hypothetical protein PcP3B5_03310 [Pseudomonas citronellolis]